MSSAPQEREHTCPRPSRGPFINGVRIDPLGREDFLHRIDRFLECGLSHVVHFIPADPTVVAMKDSAYRRTLNEGDLNVADGMSVVWASRLLGHRTERLPGADALALLGRWGLGRGLGHYVFGSTPTVLKGLNDRMALSFPGIRIAGSESPPFRRLSPRELEMASARIRESGTDVLWVGLGTPKQDVVADGLRKLNTAPVIMCIGAAFDFVAGATKRAPNWMQKAGMEWVYRLAIDPRRLWRRYLVGNPLFVWGVLRDGASSVFAARSSR